MKFIDILFENTKKTYKKGSKQNPYVLTPEIISNVTKIYKALRKGIVNVDVNYKSPWDVNTEHISKYQKFRYELYPIFNNITIFWSNGRITIHMLGDFENIIRGQHVEDEDIIKIYEIKEDGTEEYIPFVTYADQKNEKDGENNYYYYKVVFEAIEKRFEKFNIRLTCSF